jgi:hypothetical protein
LASLNHFTFPLAIRAASCGLPTTGEPIPHVLRTCCAAVLGKSTPTCGPYIGTPWNLVKQNHKGLGVSPSSPHALCYRLELCFAARRQLPALNAFLFDERQSQSVLRVFPELRAPA